MSLSLELSGTTWFNLSAAQLGRRRELIIAALLYLLGGVLTASAPDLIVLLVGRLLYGLGIGSVSFLKPTGGISGRFIMMCLPVTFLHVSHLTGYAWGSVVHSRNLPVSDTWYTDISTGIIC
ncbi:hypothetical protein V6N12_064814 [Hibiscus sabdariffa]|uniref:Major facilitator superfamily (MFS) profile domain-containing protein n=1 Tax=Hibiscus sabdariffa TaxID=183260 RepID=A0ABR2G8A4_9ROSI